jgi:hypothetical protein
MALSPLVDFFRRGEVAHDVRLLAAQGAFAPRAEDQLMILMILVDDADPEIRGTAERTLSQIPVDPLARFLARSDTPVALREFFGKRGIAPADEPGDESDAPLVVAAEDAGTEESEAAESQESTMQRIQKMGFTERLKAAVKGSREMRMILIRDPNKMIAAAVLSSPKMTEPEVESIARMANVADEVLRTIGSNRAWTKNYSIVVGLTKNPKTPLAMSMNFMQRLTDRDLSQLSVDRNVPEPLRVAARKKLLANTSR